MRSVYSRFAFRNFRRQKFYSFLFSFGILSFCSLIIVLYRDSGVLDASYVSGHQVNMRYKQASLELNSMDLMSSRRHNRNLQNLFSKDSFDEKKKGLPPLVNDQFLLKRMKDEEIQVPDRSYHQMTLDNSGQHRNKPTTQETPRKRLPQAIIIGVKKCGTRALLEFLRIHPDVRATGPEPHFFDRHYDKGLDYYRNLMPASTAKQITIEKTPKYFITKDAPEKVYNMSRSIKLIVVVRDPITRAISDYTQVASKRLSMKSFEEMAISDNETGKVETSWAVIKVGTYSKHLSEWLRFFPLKQFHFVHGENMIKNPTEEMKTLQDFLGLKPYINSKHFFMNDTRGFPCIMKNRSKVPHCLLGSKGRKHPNVDKRVVKSLQNFYRPYNKRFYKMIGKDFKWP